jgi:hypothetical protein
LATDYLRRGRRGRAPGVKHPLARLECILEVDGNRDTGPATWSAARSGAQLCCGREPGKIRERTHTCDPESPLRAPQ